MSVIGFQRNEKAPDTRPRYRGVRILGSCEHCGMPLPIPGVLRRLHCSHCQGLNLRSEHFWTTVIDKVDNHQESFEFRNNQVDVWLAAPPTSLDEDVHDAPEWLRSDVRQVRRIFGAAQEGIGAGPEPQVGEAAKPVVMNCPKCSAALEVTGESERTVACQYCSAAVYLPDPLWQRLHPVQRAEWWFIEYQGESLEVALQRQEKMQQIEIDRQEEAQREIQRREQEERAARIELAAEAEQPAGRSSLFGWVLAIGLAVAAAVLGFLLR